MSTEIMIDQQCEFLSTGSLSVGGQSLERMQKYLEAIAPFIDNGPRSYNYLHKGESFFSDTYPSFTILPLTSAALRLLRSVTFFVDKSGSMGNVSLRLAKYGSLSCARTTCRLRGGTFIPVFNKTTGKWQTAPMPYRSWKRHQQKDIQ